MSATPSTTPQSESVAPADRKYLVDIDSIDLTATLADRETMFDLIPHRHEMALLDRIVWAQDGGLSGVAAMKVQGDEFWVRGHFPNQPMLPGVLMVEAGAQLSCYLYNLRMTAPQLAAFLRIENAAFRRSVTVGEELFLLCDVVKASDRRFISDIQGVVDGQVCFEARISGMRIGEFER